jgi:dihydroorotase
LFDPEEPWQVTADSLASAGKNTPFLGYEMQGRVHAVGLRGVMHSFAASL